MPRQLEDPEYPHDAEELGDSPHLGQLADVGRVDEGDGGEVGQDGKEVDDVHQRLDELDLARAGNQADLKGNWFFSFGVGSCASVWDFLL